MTASPTTKTAQDAARQTIRTVAGLIAEARRALGSGAAVRLAPLQEQTRAACAAVRALEGDDAVPLRADLEAVLYDLDALATDLSSRYGHLALRNEPLIAGGRRPPTMGSAYRTSEPLPTPDDKVKK